MKILCLTHYYIEENRSGGEMMIHGLLKSLAQKGHDVTALITNNCRLNTVIDGVKVIYGVDKTKVLNTYEYDVLITQFENTATAVTHAHNNNKPVVVVVHNDMTYTQNVINTLNQNDMVIFNTEWIKNKLKTPAKSIVVHPPISTVKQGKEDRQYVTLVNMVKEKGSDLFYQISRSMPNVLFMAVKGGYWKDRQSIQSCVNVLVVENTPDMYKDVYSKSKIVLMPSTYESYGMVAAEAATYGIPVICTPLDGLKENMGDAGIYISPTDTAAWVDNIRQLLSIPEYYDQQSKKCKEMAKNKTPDLEISNFIKEIEGLSCQSALKQQ